MNPASISFQPVARDEYLDRFEVLLDVPELSPEFWADVDDKVQKELAPLDETILRSLGAVRIAKGRTKGNAFLHYSYRAFSMPDSAIDPVIVSITFTRSQQGVSVEADISGERNGDIIAAFVSKAVASSRDDILAAAVASAQELRGAADSIVVALQDDSRGIE